MFAQHVGHGAKWRQAGGCGVGWCSHGGVSSFRALYGTASRPAVSDTGPVRVPTAALDHARPDWSATQPKEATSMAYSSIMGADKAPTNPSGRESELLGPSDNSDSGSDTVGTSEAHEDSDSRGTGERGAVAGADAREGGDILPDRVVNLANGEGSTALASDAMDLTDLDAEDLEAAADGDLPDDRG
jgi:hypothetical protein